MDPIIFSILLIVIVLAVLYFLIKAAVRDGMLAYDQIKRQEEQAKNGGAPQDAPEKNTQPDKKEDG